MINNNNSNNNSRSIEDIMWIASDVKHHLNDEWRCLVERTRQKRVRLCLGKIDQFDRNTSKISQSWQSEKGLLDQTWPWPFFPKSHLATLFYHLLLSCQKHKSKEDKRKEKGEKKR